MKTMGATDTKIILVIDEHTGTRDEVLEVVRRLGCIGIPAPDCDSGNVIARKLHVNAIVVRLGEDVAAVAAFAELRRRRPDAAVIVLAPPYHPAEPLLRSAGADVMLSASATLAELADSLRRLLGLR